MSCDKRTTPKYNTHPFPPNLLSLPLVLHLLVTKDSLSAWRMQSFQLIIKQDIINPKAFLLKLLVGKAISNLLANLTVLCQVSNSFSVSD